MSDYGLLINYEYCTGCHTCEVACLKAHQFNEDDYGIKVFQDGPRQNTAGEWEYTYIPMPTKSCDLCEDRTKMGKLPNCVHHCQSGIMFYDTLDKLAEIQKDKPRSVLYRL